MTKASFEDISQLLKAWGQGDESALDRLMPLVYDELRRRAHRQMAREKAGHTLETTALVNEAYLRLVAGRKVSWQDRAHFFTLSARLMRRILVDHARSRDRVKRGGLIQKIPLGESLAVPLRMDDNLVALDDALSALSEADSRKAQVVEMRFFGGLSVEQTAEALGVSVSTVMSDWRMAKVWLLREMQRKENVNESRAL